LQASLRFSEGDPGNCPICGKELGIDPATSNEDVPCPKCGSLLWFPRTPGLKTVYAFHTITINDPAISTKEQAIRAITDRLVADGRLPAEYREGVVDSILRREHLGSTGIGGGFALPHARHAGVKDLLGVIARFPTGVNFGSIDGEPVRTICMLVLPADQPGSNLRILEAIARQFR
jgi:mannitol/fructose-specific phosphotransferase system IIA component (Ntr-type)